ncbi:MAG: ABC transporter ATP-binding protein [Bacteriovoracaceae bacterium]|nr:ABC transporter ATP-binding protein [Bacteriovoracaceae bacterium]
MQTSENIIHVDGLDKTYAGGYNALKKIQLQIRKGEIFALLGPNGAGKTTLINIICGIVNPSQGRISVGGFDNIKNYRQTRSLIGLVPQELTTDMFETVWNTVSHSRALFGKSKNPAFIEETLKKLSLWDKRHNRIMTLSGGMKRRVMIAKALSHEPQVLFLDEPTAGVDVELRKDMWSMVHKLRQSGVTIILTTHYIEEAEMMADRIGVISEGQIILVEEKKTLMKKLGKKELNLELTAPLTALPESLKNFDLTLTDDKRNLHFIYDTKKTDDQISALFERLKENHISFKDLQTKQSSLEDIFIQLVRKT